ncbi:MAG TPA: AI-2E family transporter [Polyangia bacterium]|nr:AI-2E family transporter [Polyangia bacterium]
MTASSRRTLRVVVVVLVAAAVAATIVRAAEVLLVIFAGVLFALFLAGGARLLRRGLRIPYPVAVVVVVLGLLVAGAGLGYWIGPRVATQLADLVGELPQSIRAAVGGDRWRAWLQGLAHARDAGATMRELGALFGTASGVLSRFVEVAGGLVVTFFIGVYGAAQPAAYVDGVLRLVPVEARPRARALLGQLATTLRRWLVGRLVAMLVVGVGTTTVFLALGIPLPLALGLLAGLLTFIEYVGAMLSAVPAILFALDKSVTAAIWVAVAYTAVHAIEGYVITPLVTRRTVHFRPGFTLALQLVLGTLVGVIGLTLATPLAVVATVLVESLYIERTLGDVARA